MRRLGLLAILAIGTLSAEGRRAEAQAVGSAPGFTILRPAPQQLPQINPAPQSPVNQYMPSLTPQPFVLDGTAPNFRTLPQIQPQAITRQNMQLMAPVLKTTDGADVLPPDLQHSAAPMAGGYNTATPLAGVRNPTSQRHGAQSAFGRSGYVPESQRPQSRRRPLGW